MLTPILSFSLLWICVSSADVHILVQPTGSDSNDGIHHPVKTIEKAVSRLNDADVKGNNVFIEVRKGVHELKKTITFPRDFGHSITLRSFYNHESAYIVGGKRLNSNLFHPVTDAHVLQQLPAVAHSKAYLQRGRFFGLSPQPGAITYNAYDTKCPFYTTAVRQMKFSDAGISLPELGVLDVVGFYRQRTAEMEITFNGKALRLARWPNDGTKYLNVEAVLDGRRGNRLTYPTSVGSRAEKWRHEADLWVYGYWFYSWADDSAKVAHVDPAHHTITLGTTLTYGMRKGYFNLGTHAGNDRQGGYFRVFNALCELDQGGEYYIDRKAGILYIWPPTENGALSSHSVIVGSTIDNLVSLSHQSNIHIEDLTFESSRHYGILGDTITNSTFQRLEIKNTGSYAMHLSGSNLIIRQCDIHDTDGGVSVSGGDRKTLRPSGIIVENNHIWDFSRVGAVGSNAIALSGVGTQVKYNELANGRYTGIMWTGNDHMMTLNHVHHMCVEATDCGGIHAGRDWTYRGNVIKNNHIHDVIRRFPGGEVRGVMLDDQYSSVLIEGNVFHDNEVHFNIGGGRDNIGRYNVFYSGGSCSVDVDGRGIAGASTSNDKTLHDRLKAMPYRTGVWAQKYPLLAGIDSKKPGSPEGNQIYKNVIYRTSRHNYNYHGDLAYPKYFNIHDNYEGAHPTDFNDLSHGDYRVVCAAATWATQNNFPQPPTRAEVGPHLPVGPAYKHDTVVTKTNGPLRHSC